MYAYIRLAFKFLFRIKFEKKLTFKERKKRKKEERKKTRELKPSEAHANSYPHRGKWERGLG